MPIRPTTKVEEFQNHLRHEHRLKFNCDYSYIRSPVRKEDGNYAYNLHFLCRDAYGHDIIKHVREFGLPMKSLQVVGERNWCVDIEKGE
jgi:hypothetical protein